MAKTVVNTLGKRHRVVGVGFERVNGRLKPTGSGPCLSTTVAAGPLEARGCLIPITQLSDIPEAERGVVIRIAQQLGIPLTSDAVQTGIRLSDAYISRRGAAVRVNGVDITPAPGAAVVIYPQGNTIASSDAQLSVGSITLGAPRNLQIDTRLRDGVIALGTFKRSGGPFELGKFGLVGDVSRAWARSRRRRSRRRSRPRRSQVCSPRPDSVSDSVSRSPAGHRRRPAPTLGTGARLQSGA